MIKAKAMQETERMIVASEESLAKYNEGYREGYSDGYDKALENVQGDYSQVQPRRRQRTEASNKVCKAVVTHGANSKDSQ